MSVSLMPLSKIVPAYRRISAVCPQNTLFAAADVTGPLHDCGSSRRLLIETATYLSISPNRGRWGSGFSASERQYEKGVCERGDTHGL